MSRVIRTLNVLVATQVFPRDGKGTATTEYGTPKTTGSVAITYTATTATYGVTAAMATGAVGDYVFTASGHWGVLTAASTTTVATVDKWRSLGAPSGGALPVSGTDTVRIMEGKNIEVGSRGLKILTIQFLKATAADTLSITDMKGTALWTYTVPATPITEPIDFRDGGQGGFYVEGPFGMKASAANTQVMVTYTDAD